MDTLSLDKSSKVNTFKNIIRDSYNVSETPQSKLWRRVFSTSIEQGFKIETAGKLADKAVEEYQKRVY